MNNQAIHTTIEVLGKNYPIKCQPIELASLQQAASLLNQKMKEVQDSGKAINFERIAVITALNLAHQFLQIDQQKNSLTETMCQHIMQMQDKLDAAVNQGELLYTTE
ncbi:MAG TPA: cell division protein ZapA [Gammaproteobacteria bacterium]|jgi:cell division protein ZapA|nr:cell division protein ZapA [Gammaproteobacteria bacterium]